MANSELYNKTYKIPSEVLKFIQTTLISNPNNEGVRRAKHVLKNGNLTYQAIKRLKNFFDHFNPQVDNKIQYALAGGDLMKSFIQRTLSTERDGVKRSKEIRLDMHANPNSELHAYQNPRLNEEKEKKKEVKKNAIAVIVNRDNKILLLKRSKKSDWMPNQWSLVGGGIEKGETPEKACKREIEEETTLQIDEFVKTFTIQRNPESIEHIFACRYNGDPTSVNLNQENIKYGWFDISEMKFLDIIPNLIEYITLVFTGEKYE
jgi:mutator protein MutT